MNKNLLSLAIAGALASPLVAFAADPAPTPEHAFTGNVTIASEYIYRGIGQTNRKPALQGGFDYAHSSGLYAGIWGSNISWLSDLGGISSSIELDVYGGYKGTYADDFSYDVGVLTYNYPGIGFGVVGLAHVDTNAKGDAGEPYRNPFNKDLSKDRLLLTFGKTF